VTAPSFEADLDPQSGSPRLRFNFVNGWSASLLIVAPAGATRAMQASVAAAPTGAWGSGQTDLLETAATADQAVRALAQIARRRPHKEPQS
jgi:hypothetical protein